MTCFIVDSSIIDIMDSSMDVLKDHKMIYSFLYTSGVNVDKQAELICKYDVSVPMCIPYHWYHDTCMYMFLFIHGEVKYIEIVFTWRHQCVRMKYLYKYTRKKIDWIHTWFMEPLETVKQQINKSANQNFRRN